MYTFVLSKVTDVFIFIVTGNTIMECTVVLLFICFNIVVITIGAVTINLWAVISGYVSMYKCLSCCDFKRNDF